MASSSATSNSAMVLRRSAAEMRTLMLDITLQAEAMRLLNSAEHCDVEIFKAGIERNYSSDQIAQSKLLQFGLQNRKHWLLQVMTVIKKAKIGKAKGWTSDQWKTLIYDGLAPFTPDPDVDTEVAVLLMGCYVKQFVNKHLCYGFVDASVITQLAKFIGIGTGQSPAPAKAGTCLEVGAGNGLWSRLLACEGITITATDLFEEHLQSHGRDQNGIFYPITKASADDAVAKFPCDCLLLVWPKDYQFPDKFSGSKVIYVGELGDGCTSGQPPSEQWELTSTVQTPRFPFAKDAAYLYERSSRHP